MNWVVPILAGLLYGCGLYLLMRRSMLRLLIGLVLLSHAANLVLFSAAGIERENPPLIAEGEQLPPVPYADPLPQALILTAIVISFGVSLFSVALIYRAYRTTGTDDLDALITTEK